MLLAPSVSQPYSAPAGQTSQAVERRGWSRSHLHTRPPRCHTQTWQCGAPPDKPEIGSEIYSPRSSSTASASASLPASFCSSTSSTAHPFSYTIHTFAPGIANAGRTVRRHRPRRGQYVSPNRPSFSPTPHSSSLGLTRRGLKICADSQSWA